MVESPEKGVRNVCHMFVSSNNLVYPTCPIPRLDQSITP
jgi:hypothetical protein